MAAAAVVLAALAGAPAAAAKSFSLPNADVVVTVRPDGSLRVVEKITFFFDGTFTGAYREIPVRNGESLTDAFVAENGRRYEPGASAELGSSGAPGTFGTTRTDQGTRIVWHFQATDQQRTFTVGYTLRGVTVAHDDVADVNLKVWGDQWNTGLGRLTATMTLPGVATGPRYRVWGHPYWVHGDVARLPRRAFLRALGVPAHQFVELRVVFPRRLLTSTAGATVQPGNAFGDIVAAEAADQAAVAHDQEKIDDAKRHIGRTLLIVLLLALVPALAVIVLTYVFYGREPSTGYDREYEQEPPTDTAPALVPPLVREGTEVGAAEFTATLFDLIRRGVYKAEAVTTERKIWGGLRTQEVADLELSRGQGNHLEAWERPVERIVEGVLAGAPERLSKFRDKIEDDRTTNAKRFKEFKDDVANAIKKRRWYADGWMPLLAGIVVFAVVGAILFVIAYDGWRPNVPRWGDVVVATLAVCAFVNAAVLFVAMFAGRVWRRRTRDAQLEAQRWNAFRHYLQDFPRLQDAPPATLELWERYLVYGIAFGIAERVLQGAQLHMPAELHHASTIYWISPTGDLGGGPTALGISDLSSGFGSALAPPGSGSGGGGGGFSGGGGGG
ncbi:MAG TPA: DUF2207 domain-containing protein, partial [Gaiellaceae bacterium]|nr:DUF2207 domain-containing protein [Gaiellaceae bacterium]